MFFPDYSETKVVYHVAPITDFDKILKEGIKYMDKVTYKSKYESFHEYIDLHKTVNIPEWVIRKRAIFASINFPKDHHWHSHSVILAVKIEEKKCWVANENLANQVYEPFILKDVIGYEDANMYLKNIGSKTLSKYWETSLSFIDNLNKNVDKSQNYDSEVLIFHEILPSDIEPVAIVSDHRIMTVDKWKKLFKGGM